MLPGGLCNPAHKGTMITPDSSYDWRSFGEHVRGSAFGDGIQYNSMSRSASSSLRETGLIYVSIEDMEAIAHAKTIAIRIEGRRRAATFDEKDIAKTFIPNLAAFYAEKIGL